MAGNKYYLLKIDSIDGESPDPDYPGYFEIYNWTWDMFMIQTMQTGSGMASGKASLGSFGFDKTTDKASALLAQACASGQHLKNALLICRKQGLESGALEEFAKYTFTDVVVTSFKLNGMSGGGEIPTERLDVAFGEVRIDYEEKKLGKGQGFIGAFFNSKTNAVG